MLSLLEICWLLCIKKIRTNPYHPQTDGIVERFNGTLKCMLRRQSQKNCDEYLPYWLFAYQEAPQESTGFCPFDILYGRHVRDPTVVLVELQKTREMSSAVPLAIYIIDARLTSTDGTLNYQNGQQKQKQYYDRGAKSHM